MQKLYSLEKAIDLIPNNATVNITGSGGGLMDAEYIYKGIEKKFLETGEPNNLTLMHVTGVGSGNETGVGHFAHKGLVKRVIGGHWLWSKKMAQLTEDEAIEAYNLPQGVLSKLTREIASGQPGLLTTIGLNTFIDPRIQGGKLNKSATEDLVELVTFQGKEMLFYKAFPIDVAIVRGSVADEEGNISTEFEAVDLEILSAAQAAYNSGGIIIAQVKRLAKKGSLNPRMVRVPGHMVTAVVVDSKQWQTCDAEYNPALCGVTKIPMDFIEPLEFSVRKIVARRAARELKPGYVVNLGIGMSDGVANVVSEQGNIDDFVFSVEQGIVGGVPVKGLAFGAGWNPSAIIAMSEQFDFYHGGGLDMTCLGMAQVDQFGNVNVSRFGKKIPGSGGFIDISQKAKRVTFCGTFTSGGGSIDVKDGKLVIGEEGKARKFLKSVEQITFSSKNAVAKGQPVLYVTERAVFKLGDGKLVLIEIAPGVDLEKDILAHMDFRPEIAENLKTMDAALFKP
jgi:propionate CoA-transferase